MTNKNYVYVHNIRSRIFCDNVRMAYVYFFACRILSKEHKRNHARLLLVLRSPQSHPQCIKEICRICCKSIHCLSWSMKTRAKFPTLFVLIFSRSCVHAFMCVCVYARMRSCVYAFMRLGPWSTQVRLYTRLYKDTHKQIVVHKCTPTLMTIEISNGSNGRLRVLKGSTEAVGM